MYSVALERHELSKWFLVCVMNKYSDFTGRARRKEFWMYTLASFLFSLTFLSLSIIASTIAVSLGMLFALLYVVISLALICPTLALSVRRLHDTGKSGWWLLTGLIPVVGALYLIYVFSQRGQPGPNPYGPDPKDM